MFMNRQSSKHAIIMQSLKELFNKFQGTVLLKFLPQQDCWWQTATDSYKVSCLFKKVKTMTNKCTTDHAEVLPVASLVGDLSDGAESATRITLQLHTSVVLARVPDAWSSHTITCLHL